MFMIETSEHHENTPPPQATREGHPYHTRHELTRPCMVGIPYGLLYLLAAPRSIWKRIAYLALAGLLLLAISLSWALAVDLTPASLRPYVGSSQNNSEISLALGYNGINRLIGQFGRGGNANAPGGNRGAPPTFPGTPPVSANGNAAQEPPAGFGGAFESGAPGLMRLFNEPLAGQIAWLLP